MFRVYVRRAPIVVLVWLTVAFSYGARLACGLREEGYLRSMLSRRQLQGFVGRRVHYTLQYSYTFTDVLFETPTKLRRTANIIQIIITATATLASVRIQLVCMSVLINSKFLPLSN